MLEEDTGGLQQRDFGLLGQGRARHREPGLLLRRLGAQLLEEGP